MSVRIPTNGIELHVVREGPEDGPLVLLLHGFPEFWYGWRKLIGPLAERGYRVVAPDQRGYNLSDKPKGIRAYHLDELANDVLGLIDAHKRERAVLVGHDWGAAVAWYTAIRHPERVERLAIMNVPHPMVMRRHLLSNLRQIRRSWYIFFFQLPLLPEAAFGRAGGKALFDAMAKTGRPDTFSSQDMDEYLSAWSQPGARSSMINWYRAVRYTTHTKLPNRGRVQMPTLLVWGKKDAFLGYELVEPSLTYCDQADSLIFEDATHWVQHEEAPRIVDRLDQFIR